MQSHPGHVAPDDEREVDWDGDERWPSEDHYQDRDEDIARLLEDVPPHHVER